MSKHLTETRFSDLPIHEKIVASLNQSGFEFCTPIQAKTLPITLLGKDVAGQAQTGTGKTMAFLIATVHYLLTHPIEKKANQPRAMIMSPTRELSIQIAHDAEKLLRDTGLQLALAYGGEGYDQQVNTITQGVDILVGTTGRMIDYVKQGIINLDCVQVAVLDEADRMFDLGFIKDIRYLMRKSPKPEQRLTLLFSATLSPRVRELAYEDMHEAQYVEVEPLQRTGHRIKEKMALLLTLLEEEWPERCIIFSNTKHKCEEIWRYLQADGHRVGLLTGDIPQKKRVAILEGFTAGNVDILVATDVAARGLHIPQVTHVFNYDLPDDREDYVHRIGRTGRAGESGHSISFACERYAVNLPAIEEYIGHAIPVSQYDSQALLHLPKVSQPRTRSYSPNKRKR